MRRFLISYYGVCNNGQNFVGSCIVKLSDGEKMTSKRLDALMEEAKEVHDDVAKVIPIAISEMEIDEEDEK